jgi:glycerol-3-phosphate dehydrogenase
MLTLVPWRGHAIVGTSHSTRLVTPNEREAAGAEIDAFIREANEAFPALTLTRERITLVHRGLVPAAVRPGQAPGLLAAPAIEDHGQDGMPGAMTVVGVKYTTARAVAERAIERAGRALGRRLRRSATAVTVLPGAGLADHEGLAIETARRSGLDLAPLVLQRLSALYAERSAEIIGLMAERPALREVVDDGVGATAVEIVHVIREEMAIHLTDIVVRRLGLGAAGHPGAAALSTCARIAAAELGWSEGKTAQEMAAVEDIYHVP